MYVGRFIVVAPGIGAYRVSSRSFPNRQITDRGGTLTVEPTADAPPTDNPYIAYNCLRVLEDRAVIGNGSHVDPIAEKLELGYPARDALAEALLALDYEKDDYNTPRIAGIIDDGSENESENGSGDESNADTYVGIVRRDALLVRAVHEPTIVATYERDRPGTFEFDATTAEEAAIALYNHEYEHPVCAAGITVKHEETTSIETAIVNEQ